MIFSKLSIKKRITLVAVVLLIYPAYVMLLICCYSFQSSDKKADAAIVLGAAVWHQRPSPVFEERIKHALHLYRVGQVDRLIFTGGVGQGEKYSEAFVAMQYAVNQGIPRNKILIEEQSKYTIENLKFADDLMHRHHLKTVLLVSDPLHMKRAMQIAQGMSMNAFPSPTLTTRYRGLASKADMLLSETRYFIAYQLRTLLARVS